MHHAKEKSLRDRPHQRGASRIGSAVEGLHVALPGGRASQDRTPGEPGTGQRPYRGSPRYATPDRQQVDASIPCGFLVLTNSRVAGDRPAFPPSVAVAIKALACELPCRGGLPLSRWSVAELRHEAVASGIVAQISGTTLWRWLSQDALRPWHHRSWIFPRDPQFARKAGRLLDLYLRRWKGAALGPSDYVLCTDEKASIQARRCRHRSLPPASHRPIYVEHEYVRAGALAYLAAWDVHRAKLFGRCERKNGIAAFERL